MPVRLTILYHLIEDFATTTKKQEIEIDHCSTYEEVFEVFEDETEIALKGEEEITMLGGYRFGKLTPDFREKNVFEHLEQIRSEEVKKDEMIQINIETPVKIKTTEILEEGSEGYLLSLLGNSNYVKAAKAIQKADIIIFATGAGWSADSGLATYPGVADIEPYRKRDLDYFDICQPHWRRQEPETFFGFWGDCCNVYRSTPFHGGYAIALKWKERLRHQSRIVPSFETEHSNLESASSREHLSNFPFFSLTSNVDAHWWNPNKGALFDRNEVYEIHGHIETWQCASRVCGSDLWALDKDFVFDVDQSTMLASEPYPRCPECNKTARPSILMFGDGEWKEDEVEEDRWDDFKHCVENVSKNNSDTNIVIVEIGAGQRVPSIRYMGEGFLMQLNGKRSLIRINPDTNCLGSAMLKGTDVDYITLQNTGFDALKKLDTLVEHFDENEGTN